jgi:hypothetical protein
MTSTSTTTPPTRAPLPTAAEADLMSGRAFAEAARELREEDERKIFLGPVNVNDGTVGRLVELPTGGLRIEYWKRGAGWIEAPKSLTLSSFMPGKMKPVSAELAARFDIPAAELDDITAGEIAIAKHEMSRPRKIYGLLYGTVVSELPSPASRDRAKIVGLIKTRAWDLACRRMPPGHA